MPAGSSRQKWTRDWQFARSLSAYRRAPRRALPVDDPAPVYAKRRNPLRAMGPFNRFATSFRFKAPAISSKASSTAVR
jgi:hypothetical protein